MTPRGSHAPTTSPELLYAGEEGPVDDDVRQLVGGILIAVGILDPLLGIFVVGPRIRDESKRRLAIVALVGSAAVLVTLGLLFLVGALGT
jgi:hypothetical protein